MPPVETEKVMELLIIRKTICWGPQVSRFQLQVDKLKKFRKVIQKIVHGMDMACCYLASARTF
jgi:hypothetical protein